MLKIIHYQPGVVRRKGVNYFAYTTFYSCKNICYCKAYTKSAYLIFSYSVVQHTVVKMMRFTWKLCWSGQQPGYFLSSRPYKVRSYTRQKHALRAGTSAKTSGHFQVPRR